MRPSKLYPFTIPANGSVNLLVSGDYFKVKSSTGSLTVIGDSFGALAGLLAGQGLRDTNFSRLTLVDETGAQNSGYLLVSDGTFIDDRVTGEVSVIDGELSRSKSGNSYMCWGSTPAVVAQFGYLEIWNPSGSGKRIVVSDVSFSSNAVGTFLLSKLASTLGASSKSFSKSSIASVSASNFGASTVATVPGTVVDLALTAASQPFIKFFKQPFVCEPNSGLLIANNSANAVLYASFQFFEEPV